MPPWTLSGHCAVWTVGCVLQAMEGVAMSIGLLGLLDDIAAIAKVAAASLDEVAAQATKAGAKAAAVVIDDAAVTPRYVFGFSAKRELPIVARIAACPCRKPNSAGK